MTANTKRIYYIVETNIAGDWENIWTDFNEINGDTIETPSQFDTIDDALSEIKEVYRDRNPADVDEMRIVKITQTVRTTKTVVYDE